MQVASRRRQLADRKHRPQAGFTLVELMVALTVLLIGITGILALQLTALQASGYSRHATEATVLAEDSMEYLRTQPTASLVTKLPPGDRINAQGLLDATGLYQRSWAIVDNPDGTRRVVVTVQWLERGSIPKAITLEGLRR